MRTFDAETIQWKSLSWEEGLPSLEVPCSERGISSVPLRQKYIDQVLRLLSAKERNTLYKLSNSQYTISRLLAVTLDDQVFSTPKLKLSSRILKSFCLLSEEFDLSYLQTKRELLCLIVNSKPFVALNSQVKEILLDLFDICPIAFKYELMRFLLDRDYTFGRLLNPAKSDQTTIFKCLYSSCNEAQQLKHESCWLQLATLLLQHVAEVIEGPATGGRKRTAIKILAKLFCSVLQEQLHSSKSLFDK